MITLAANMKTGHSNQQAFFCPVLYTLTMFKDEVKIRWSWVFPEVACLNA